MDPVTLAVAAGLYAAAAVARQVEDDVAGAVWKALKAALGKLLGREPQPTDATAERIARIADTDSELALALGRLWNGSSVLRRARLAASALQGARILWIDDEPAGNVLERETLNALGVTVQSAETTRSAIACLRRESFDLILSDIARPGSATEGLDALSQIRTVGGKAPVVFYIMNLQQKGVPEGAFGIATRPDELLHLCMDVFERGRL